MQHKTIIGTNDSTYLDCLIWHYSVPHKCEHVNLNCFICSVCSGYEWIFPGAAMLKVQALFSNSNYGDNHIWRSYFSYYWEIWSLDLHWVCLTFHQSLVSC
jgi:hypothetical protein